MAGASNWVFDVDESSFQQLVLEQSMQRPVVVDLWAPSCAPCRTLGPMLERLTREQQGNVVLAKVNVEDHPQIAAAFRIEAIPAVRAIKDGKIVDYFDGIIPEPELREFFARLGGPRVDPTLLRAGALEENKPAEAESLYRKFLEKEPTSEAARVGLARVLAAQNKVDEIESLLEPIGSDSEYAAEAQRIRSVLSLRGLSADVTADEASLRKQIQDNPKSAQPRYELGCLLAQKGKHEEALEMLLSAGERDMKLAPTKVREAMVQIFYALGTSHPLSDAYRAKLARLLY